LSLPDVLIAKPEYLVNADMPFDAQPARSPSARNALAYAMPPPDSGNSIARWRPLGPRQVKNVPHAPGGGTQSATADLRRTGPPDPSATALTTPAAMTEKPPRWRGHHLGAKTEAAKRKTERCETRLAWVSSGGISVALATIESWANRASIPPHTNEVLGHPNCRTGGT
jgi:hypothetical protein